ncbi:MULTISPECIES: hypothetical protein [unclassified Paenibacillus]|uniref:hypothetical protein n=1 Tax=unclassified Paenibacillus TaxID=185978 RepID=UPI0002D3363F|nr:MULTISPECIES: hypothetical protein [unclassified Paenibacillus]EPD80470.1 hypothetical protein HMPREF1207_05685 [Paenibacillus sp. HGH0039]
MTIEFSKLHEDQLIEHDGWIISKQEAEELILSGSVKTELYTVEQICIEAILQDDIEGFNPLLRIEY